MTAESVAPDIEKIRAQVVDLACQAKLTLDEIDSVARRVDKLRHDQQNLRQTLVTILDVLDRLTSTAT